MDDAREVLTLISLFVFVLIALVAADRWRRLQDAASAWLAVTFIDLAFVAVAARFTPETDPVAADIFTKALIAALVFFPYALYRFVATFQRFHRTVDLLAIGSTFAMVAATAAFPRFPLESEPAPPGMSMYIIVFLVHWTWLSVVVITRLWRASRSQPTVTRRRLKMMAAGATVLNVSLLLSGSNASDNEVVAIVQSAFAILSAPLFLLGFAPPAVLRATWRRPEESSLREVEVALMTAVDATEIGASILPRVFGLVGGHGAVLADNAGDVLAADGDTRRARLLAVELGRRGRVGTELETHDLVIAVPLQTGWLLVETTPYTPFFGRDEIELLRLLGVMADLSLARAELFERERRVRWEVELANNELEALVYGISHDLKSPLVSLLGYLGYLEEDHLSTLDAQGRQFVAGIRSSATYMQQLIQDLLELSRVGRTQTTPEDVDLDELLRDIGVSLGPRHPDLDLDVGSLPVVRLNPVRARQLFTNLIENAALHGGRPDLTVRVRGIVTEGGAAQITVADDGVGIPRHYREKVFGIFERLSDADDTGTGIGLTMCRKIIESVGGAISIQDTDVGTKLRIDLPAPAVAVQPDITRPREGVGAGSRSTATGAA